MSKSLFSSYPNPPAERERRDTSVRELLRGSSSADSGLKSLGASFKRIGLLNDYLRIPYANGSSFASQFFYRELKRRGHDVTVVGPEDPAADAEDCRRLTAMKALPLRMHPGVQLSMPKAKDFDDLVEARFDAVVCQTSSALMEYGVWLRRNQGVPLLCVNTVHLPSVYNTVLPDALNKSALVNRIFQDHLIPFAERSTVEAFNSADGLALAPGMKKYWEERGVTVPIHVIPRAVEPKTFDRELREDPFPAHFARGSRVVVVCRHTREKEVTRLLNLFATEVRPRCPEATLTLVGDGPDHEEFIAQAERLGLADVTHFPGEVAIKDIAEWYGYADVFAYTSLSETYGQVVSEALWTGLPVVAFDDQMGVAGQISHGRDGFLLAPGPDTEEANREFGLHLVQLLQQPELRAGMGAEARRLARHRSDPGQCVSRLYDALASARVNCSQKRPWESASKWSKVQPKIRMALLHGLVFGLGLLRKPVKLNRNGVRQQGWDTI